MLTHTVLGAFSGLLIEAKLDWAIEVNAEHYHHIESDCIIYNLKIGIYTGYTEVGHSPFFYIMNSWCHTLN